jgi:hypothetical protein
MTRSLLVNLLNQRLNKSLEEKYFETVKKLCEDQYSLDYMTSCKDIFIEYANVFLRLEFKPVVCKPVISLSTERHLKSELKIFIPVVIPNHARPLEIHSWNGLLTFAVHSCRRDGKFSINFNLTDKNILVILNQMVGNDRFYYLRDTINKILQEAVKNAADQKILVHAVDKFKESYRKKITNDLLNWFQTNVSADVMQEEDVLDAWNQFIVSYVMSS